MITKEELSDKYASLSNEELLEIVDNKSGYTKLALIAALEELSKRKVSEAEVKKYKEGKLHKAMDDMRKNYVDGLSLLQKHMFYFICIPLINFAFKQNFRDDGYVLKLRQANYYTFCGFLFLMLTVLISVSTNLSSIQSLGVWLLGIIPTYAFDQFFYRQRLVKKLAQLSDTPPQEDEATKTGKD
ncbi:MAG TPA: hypothetical protein VGM41_11300 [Chitinophagaceae bacterium]